MPRHLPDGLGGRARKDKMGCTKRLGSEKSRLVLLCTLAAVAMLLTACAGGERGGQPTATPTREPGYSTHQTFNRSLTIDNVTVVLDAITHSASRLSTKYSYSSTTPEVSPKQLLTGFSLTRADGTTIFPRPGGYPLNSRIPGGEGELVDISLGSYLVPANVSGSVTIDLGTAYKTAMENPPNDGPTIAPLDAGFWIGDRKYRVAKMIVFPIEFRLWIEPVNEAARRTDLGKATLVDNTGNPYKYTGGRTSFDNLSPKGHEWRQFIFIGIIPESKTSLTLTVQGGENIVGPFVFEDVRVVSDEAPAGAGVAAGGAATPVRVSE